VGSGAQLHVYVCLGNTILNRKAEKYYSNRISAIAKHHEARSNQATLNLTDSAIFLQCLYIYNFEQKWVQANKFDSYNLV
jgi:hypothetical protein